MWPRNVPALQRYASEFSGKHNIRDSGTLAQMRDTVARLVGRNLHYPDLIADNGLYSGARTQRLHAAQQRLCERFGGRAR